MNRTDLFKFNTKEYWADLAVYGLLLVVITYGGDAMMNVNSQPWYLVFLFFMAVFMVTDHFMQYIRLLPVWPWKRDA